MVRRRAKALLVAAGLCALFAIGAPAAFAAYTEVGTFAGGGSGPGGSGSGNGELFNPGQADVNDDTGYLYVADTGNDRVQVFKPNATGGEYDSQAAVPGAVGLAIDQTNGSVYVSTATGIAKLTAALAPAAVWTDPAVTGALAVDPATGDLLVADTAGNLIRRFNSDGSTDGTFAATRPVDLAANSSGQIFVVTTTGNIGAGPCGPTSAVERFSGAGVSEGTLPSLTVPGAVAIDPDDDAIRVATYVNEYFCEQGNRPAVTSFAADGTLEGELELAPDTMYAAVSGLAVAGGDSTRAYAITKSPTNDSFGATKVTTLEVPPSVAPEVLGQSALRGSTDATLRAQIGAGGASTEYHFEYGLTAAYGEETDPGTLPGSFDSAGVSAEISGLTPGTTYHYRVLASNSEGDAQGADRTFTTTESGGGDACPNEAFRTGASAHLTDCRAFELVTPPDSDADIRVVGGPVTPAGDTACFNTEDALADADPNGIKTADQGFCAWRGASGWETKWVTGPAPAKRVSSMGSNVYLLSPDGQRAIFASDAVLFGDDYIPPPGSTHGSEMSAYMWEGGQTTWLTPAGPPVGDPPAYEQEKRPENKTESGSAADRRPLATSADLRQGIFESILHLLPEDENNVVDVYEWYPGGLRIVSRDSTGKAAGGRTGIQSFLQMVAPPGAMSADGSRIFFQHDGAPLAGDATEAPEGEDPEVPTAGIQSVYMREGGELTLVSPRRGSGPDASVWFVGATADGDFAYLETTQQLTPEAKQPGRALYRYDLENDQLDLVADALGGVEFLTLSPDGSTIVYRERLSNALIVEREGVATTLGTLAASDVEAEQGVAYGRPDARMLRVTPDGRVVVFGAAGEVAGFGPGPVQIYRWEAGEGVERISAEEGHTPQKPASIGAYVGLIMSEREELFAQHTARGGRGRVISDDGSRVFFETTEALVKRDVNAVTDVYEWHDGEVNIVSSGTGAKALYHDSSADGKTVFITTFDRLLPEWDRNSKRDLYVAMPDGGFAPPPPPPDCQGESCQPGQPAPPATNAGRGSGEGNLQRGLATATLVKGGKSIRVGVLAPGRVTATLSGKLGKGKPTTVSKASKVASKAGALSLPVRLSQRASKLLTERGRLTLTLTVTHVQSDQTITRKVTLHG
jgi:sugar lactone lactonase YvrE